MFHQQHVGPLKNQQSTVAYKKMVLSIPMDFPGQIVPATWLPTCQKNPYLEDHPS